jgi:nitric oxide reductase NorQ protein
MNKHTSNNGGRTKMDIRKIITDEFEKKVTDSEGLSYNRNITLKDLYKLYSPTINQATIRTVIFDLTKSGFLEQVSRGTYTLKGGNKTTNSLPKTSTIPATPTKKVIKIETTKTITPSNHPLAALIPTKSDYISRSMYGTSDVKLLNNLHQHKDFVLIIGETGCGKTMLANHLGFMNKAPVLRVVINGGTRPDDLVGQFNPNPNPHNPAKYVWEDGPLTKCLRYGGIFVVDEMNMAPADILSMFHSIADDGRQIVLTQKDGEIIRAHKDFYLIATMNPDYEGTKPLNLALKDRFRILTLSHNDSVEKKLNIDAKMLDVADKLRKSEEILTPVSTRDLVKYRDDIKNYGEDVARAFFKNNFELSEQNVVQEVLELVLDNVTPKTTSTTEEGEFV